jgi:hypothetical protein
LDCHRLPQLTRKLTHSIKLEAYLPRSVRVPFNSVNKASQLGHLALERSKGRPEFVASARPTHEQSRNIVRTL